MTHKKKQDMTSSALRELILTMVPARADTEAALAVVLALTEISTSATSFHPFLAAEAALEEEIRMLPKEDVIFSQV